MNHGNRNARGRGGALRGGGGSPVAGRTDPDLRAPCRHFQQGKCTFGARCKYSHATAGSTTIAGSVMAGRGRAHTGGRGGGGAFGARGSRGGGQDGQNHGGKDPIERKLNELIRLMSGKPAFSPSQAEYFLQLANEILESDATAPKQKLIMQLANEDGLKKVVFFVEAKYSLDAALGTMNFWYHCVPFLKVITNEDIRTSLVLETAVGTIYNIFYGHSGARAKPFFTTATENLSRTTTYSRTSAEFGGGVSATVGALEMLLDVNQSAAVQKEFLVVVKAIRRIFPTGGTDHATRLADMQLRTVEQKLGMGEAIPERRIVDQQAERQTERNLAIRTSAAARTNFRPVVDLPGRRSENGPRHDNDKESITDIRILPTKGEILSMMRTEYFPVRDYDPQAHHLRPGIARILDTQFRLLREDTSGQLRDAVRFVLDTMAKNPEKLGRNPNGIQTAIYKNVVLERFRSGDREALEIDVTFDQPQKLLKLAAQPAVQPNVDKRKAMSERMAYWGERSKFMQVGALLCLVDSHGGITFVLVTSRSAGDEDMRNGPHRRGKGKGKNNEPDTPEDEDSTSSQPRDLVSHPTRALVTLKLVDNSHDLRTVVKEYQRQLKLTAETQYVFPYLIEFPGMLFASFDPILRFLQNMISVRKIPFTQLLAPEGNAVSDQPKADWRKPTQIEIPPPLYLVKGNVTLDLSVILKPGVQYPLRHSVARPCTLNELQRYTELDSGQCEALLGCLTRELALIQGPPGTGKSFLGVKLCKVLLHNDAKLNLGPIVCVCYTNHALDQFLEDLLESGVERIIRLGSRSKSEKLKECSLRNASSSQGNDSTYVERQEIRELKATIENTEKEIQELCHRLRTMNNFGTLKDHLEEKYPSVYRQLFKAQFDEDGFQVVSHRKPEHVIDDWIRMRHLPHIQRANHLATSHRRNLTTEELMAIRDLQQLNSAERLRMKLYWETEIRREITRSLKAATTSYEAARLSLKKMYQERDRRCLHQAQVIGVTTTGLAGQADLLRHLVAKVMVCEEAGEVLEAHTLTALLPSVEHAILIGDHKQLRPHIANYDLSMESNQGKVYKLDESLFERLTREKYGVSKILDFPIATLDTQRRMHPSISNLIRQTLYPELMDHANTNNHPEVEGMARRLFWMDHHNMEANADKSDPTNVSKSNDFEIEMVAALAKHLIKQGKYGQGDVAVLTPYLGQLQKMKKRFQGMFEILVGDKDQEELDLMGDGDNEETQTGAAALAAALTAKAKPTQKEEVRKGALSSELRLATVDNFQGEEAKVILISLVRCNPARRCGFLKTSNRINVLLSRARHGMYIIGNTDTSRGVEMWANVMTLLNRDGNLGDELQLQCSRHKHKQIFVKNPDDFLRFSPEGGCNEQCGKRLEACGHTCVNKCHSDMLHRAVVCMEDCIRSLPGCNHPCPVPCGKECLPCSQPISEVSLPCGHISYNVPCHEAQKPDKIICRRSVFKIIPGCNHKVNVACHVDVTRPSYRCRAECNHNLPCRHKCIAQCYECRMPAVPREDNSKHVKCRTVCGRPFNNCGHSCSKVCHGDECGVCEKPCEQKCSHSRCTKKCSEACTPCADQCTWSCKHRARCTMPCAVPCDILPCSKRCDEPLRCGHRCPSVCGETCPDVKYCRECAAPPILDTVVDMVCMETYREIELNSNPIIVLSCGHFFAMETVDGLMQMRDVYEYDQEGNIISQKPQSEWIQAIKPSQVCCPQCRGPLTDILRYNRVAKGILIEVLTRKFLVTAHQELLAVEQLVSVFENGLAAARNTLSLTLADLFENPPTENPISKFILDRHKPFIALKKRIQAYITSVTKEEQPYGRIHTLVTDCIRRQRVTNTSFVVDDTSVVLRNKLLGKSLLIRTFWALLYDLLKIHENSTMVGRSGDKKFVADTILKSLKTVKVECKNLERAAAKAHQPRQQVEAMLFHSRIVGLELKFAPPAPPEPLPIAFDPPRAEESNLDALNRWRAGRDLQNREYQEKVESYHAEIRDKRQAELKALDEAVTICYGAMGSTSGLLPRVEEARKAVRNVVFYSPITTAEQQAVYDAMRSELRGTGHWYYCENRHPFTVGDCGMPMERARCPQCDAPIGGENHIAVGGVERAADLEARFGTMRI